MGGSPPVFGSMVAMRSALVFAALLSLLALFSLGNGFEFDQDSCQSMLPNAGLHQMEPNDKKDEDDHHKHHHKHHHRRHARDLGADDEHEHFGDDEEDDGEYDEEDDDDDNGYHLKPQPTHTSPFTIITSDRHYRRNREMTVQIDGGDFNGFLIQARTSDHKDPTPIGKFLGAPPNTKLLACDGNDNTAASKDTGGKTNLELKWKAPNSDQGNLVFMATVIKQDKFWTHVHSDEILFKQFPPSFDSCGQKQSCYRYSTSSHDCAADLCDYVVITEVTGENEITFIIGGVVKGSSGYVGIGFTMEGLELSKMDVSACILRNKTVEAQLYMVESWDSPPHLNHQDLEDIDTDIDGSMIWCHFKRPLQSPGHELADLKQTLHHVFLWGELNQTSKLPILPLLDQAVRVPEVWNHSNTLNVMHFVDSPSSSALSKANLFAVTLVFLIINRLW